jgi:dihydroorotate dehydrogenase
LNLYKKQIRPILFSLDAEHAHDLAIGVASQVHGLEYVRSALARYTRVEDARLSVDVAGLTCHNPVGLAAGYDKSGRAVDGLAALGFGHIEVGSVSIDPSEGNPKPRLFRLPEDEAVIVHYGLQNDGAEVVRRRLSARETGIPVGVNIVKTNRGMEAPPESADTIINEYVDAVQRLHDCADYLTLNLSCPNTEDGRDFFADPDHTLLLMTALKDLVISKPMFLKISPMGDDAADDALLECVDPFSFVSGFIYNLVPGGSAKLKSPAEMWRDLPGALAGRPVQDQMDLKIASLYGRMDRKRYRIIGAGGVSCAEDAYRKIRLGASMVQLLTALVYEGPWLVKRINEGLCRLLDRDGVNHVSDIVGVDTA